MRSRRSALAAMAGLVAGAGCTGRRRGEAAERPDAVSPTPVFERVGDVAVTEAGLALGVGEVLERTRVALAGERQTISTGTLGNLILARLAVTNRGKRRVESPARDRFAVIVQGSRYRTRTETDQGRPVEATRPVGFDGGWYVGRDRLTPGATRGGWLLFDVPNLVRKFRVAYRPAATGLPPIHWSVTLQSL